MDILSYYKQDDIPFVRISAPMVRYTKLPFRLLLRKHCVDIAYSPMIMADSFNKSTMARDVEFTTCADDRPLIVQLASNDPYKFTWATQMLSPYCDGVDINCGCPQKWAIDCGLGSGLLRYPETIAEMIRSARNSTPRWRNSIVLDRTTDLDDKAYDTGGHSNGDDAIGMIRRDRGPFSVSAKIRIPPIPNRALGDDNSTNIKVTVELVRRLAAMGVDWITLHPRTPKQRPSEPADWSIVKQLVDCHIKHSFLGTDLPIFLNGDVRKLDDAYLAHSQTGCHGVMVARALLVCPNLFNVQHPQNLLGLEQLMKEWLYLSAKYSGGTCYQYVHQQTYWMMEPYLDKTRRIMLHSINTFPGLSDWLDKYWKSIYSCTKMIAN